MSRKTKPEPSLLVSKVRKWRKLREFPDYEISNDGRLRRLTAGSNAKPGAHIRVIRGNYPHYGLSKSDGKRIHRGAHTLVAAEFLPKKPRWATMVLHKDDNRLNCRDRNLKWGNAAINYDDAKRHGLIPLGDNHPSAKKPWTRPRGEKHECAKLTEVKVRKIMVDPRLHREIAESYGVDKALIGRIKSGDVWKHITRPGYSKMLEAGAAHD